MIYILLSNYRLPEMDWNDLATLKNMIGTHERTRLSTKLGLEEQLTPNSIAKY